MVDDSERFAAAAQVAYVSSASLRPPAPDFAAFYRAEGYDFATTQYRGAGIPISGEDWPRPDDRMGWEMLEVPRYPSGYSALKQGDTLHWRRRKDVGG